MNIIRLANQKYFLGIFKMLEELNIANLLPHQVEKLIKELTLLLNQQEKSSNVIYEIVKNEKNIVCCPICNSCNVVKNGHTKKGIQTYKCKDCDKRFNDLSNTIFHHTHLTYKQLVKFFECMRDKFSIRKTAKLVSISVTTAFTLRHKILDVLRKIRENIKLHGRVEVDEYYISINLKGTKQENMPRFSKPRKSNGNGKRGINSHKVCVESAIDEYDNTFLEIVGNGPITSEMAKNSLTPKLQNVSELITDCKSSYESVAKENNWNLIQIKSGTYTNEDGDSLANINSLHSGLEVFLSHFHGVSTNHLQGYLDWYMFDKYLNYTTEILEQVEVIEKNTINKTSNITYSNVYNNYSGLDYNVIYSDYNYHANSST